MYDGDINHTMAHSTQQNSEKGDPPSLISLKENDWLYRFSTKERRLSAYSKLGNEIALCSQRIGVFICSSRLQNNYKL